MSGLILTHSKRLILPNVYYRKFPTQAIKSVIGDNCKIITQKRTKEVLPNDRVVVLVEYQTVDFDSFVIYRIERPRLTNVGSDFVVSRYVYEAETNEPVNVEIKMYKPVISPFNKTVDEAYVLINTLTKRGNDLNQEYNYFGVQIRQYTNVLHSYISIFNFGKKPHDTVIGRDTQTYIPQDIPLNKYLEGLDTVPKPKIEIKNYLDMTSVATNDINSRMDSESFKKNINETCVLKNFKVPNKDFGYIIDLSEYTMKQIREMLTELHSGIIMLYNRRALGTVYYIPSDIHLIDVDNVMYVFEKDLKNVKFLYDMTKK